MICLNQIEMKIDLENLWLNLLFKRLKCENCLKPLKGCENESFCLKIENGNLLSHLKKGFG